MTDGQKILVIAEKPSVGRDLARVLPGPFAKGEGCLEGPEHVLSWAVGHLVQLAEPDEYDAKFKRWRMADLPIVPERFKLVVRDERSRKQMSVVTTLLHRDDIVEVVNACDAGREGELIFAYLYEKAGATLPVRRLWLSSMTTAAMQQRRHDRHLLARALVAHDELEVLGHDRQVGHPPALELGVVLVGLRELDEVPDGPAEHVLGPLQPALALRERSRQYAREIAAH